MSDKKIAKDLDAALEGAEPAHELEPLVEVAARLEDGMEVKAPPAGRERTLFMRGVGLRRKGFNPLRVVSPALAVVGLVAIIAFLAGRALPGQTLYPVREALDSVGLADLPDEKFENRVDEAEEMLTLSADALGSDELGRAESLALRAMIQLEAARSLIEELDRSNRDQAAAEVERLFGQARLLITSAVELRIGGDGDEDDSGPGGDDSSGPGSGDEDDSSGPGSGDEDDSSGPGSGDDDSSGPSSGSGGSGSGGGDSSGSGSGGNDSSGSGSG